MNPAPSRENSDDRRFRTGAAAAAVLLGLWYLSWRLTATLNWEGPVALTLSIVLFTAEVYGFFALLLFFFQIGKGPYRKVPVLQEYPTVDVFVTICNESVDVLYRTLVCCRAMEYPRGKMSVIVLDDGNRSEVRELAEAMGCGYLTRPDREFAKAGNLNHAFSRTEGEIVAVFDCDHIPVRTFLMETVGFFADPKVAIVQTPHFFYNPDTFQRNFRLERELANEQDLFFRVIEPGRDRYNAAFFAGSSGLFRRTALREIGGFQTLTLTEDLHTSMVLHARGWRSVYVPKILAAGLSPESFEGYLKQRKRWTRGGLQVFLLDNPLLKSGLTPAQRLQYFSALFYFFHGIPRVVYLASPLAYLFFGIAPLVAGIGNLALHFLPYYAASLIAFRRVSGGTRNPFWSDVYETAICFSVSVTTVVTFLNPWRTRFHVTPKGLRSESGLFHAHLVFPHLALVFLLLAGGVYAGYRALVGETGSSGALGISLFWGLYNLFLIFTAVAVARERRQVRQSPRLPRMIPGEIRFPLRRSGEGSAVRKIPCVTRDLSETGVSLMMPEPQILPLIVQAALLGENGDRVQLQGMVMRNDATPAGEGSVGIHFMKVPDAARQTLIRLMFSHPRGWESPPLAGADVRRSLSYVFLAPLRTFIREKLLNRYSPRFRRRIPCQIRIHDRVYPGMSEDLSVTGMRLSLAPEVLTLGDDATDLSEVIIRLQSEDGMTPDLPARVVWKEIGRRIIMGVSFLEEQPELFRPEGEDLREKKIPERFKP